MSLKTHTLGVLLAAVTASYTYANTLNDPTKPSHHKPMLKSGQNANSAGTSRLHVSAILLSPQNKQAIINGESVNEGQQILDYEVISIEQNQVVLKGPNGKQTLFVNSNNIKKDSNNGF